MYFFYCLESSKVIYFWQHCWNKYGTFLYTSQNTFVLSSWPVSSTITYMGAQILKFPYCMKMKHVLTKTLFAWIEFGLIVTTHMYLISVDAVKLPYSLWISKLIRIFCFRVIAFIIIITVIEVIIEIYCVVFWWLICSRCQLSQVGAFQTILDTDTSVLRKFLFAIRWQKFHDCLRSR